MDQSILIIGSNSFSGSHFVDYCLKNSEARVFAISRSAEPHVAYLPYKWSSDNERFQFHRFDLNHDLDAITDLVAQARPAWIVNFAAQGMVAQSWDHPEHWFRTNTLAHIQLHERLRAFDFIRKYVQVSTPEIYGHTASEVSEDAPMNPSTPYAVSKAACDMSLRTFHTRYGFPVVFTRAANVYGPGQQLYRIIPRTIIGVHTGRTLELHGGGHSVRAFVHIRDVCEATFRIMKGAEPPNVYHLTTRQVCSIRGVVEAVLEQMGVPFEEHVEVTDDAPDRDMAYTLLPDKAEKEFGWTAATSLRAGIKETIDWVERFREILMNEPLQYIHKP